MVLHNEKVHEMELKAFGFEVKANESKREFEGYASTFGNVDRHNDIIHKGAFESSIKNKLPKGEIKVLYQHFDPIGMPLEMYEDENGLFVRGKVSKTTLGNDVIILMQDGVIDKMSIGFDVMEGGQNTEKDTGIRNITDIDLWEFSPVTFAANNSADIQTLKDLRSDRSKTRIFVPASFELIDGIVHTKFADSDGNEVASAEFDLESLKEDEGSEEVKSVLPFADLPLAGRRRSWNEAEALARLKEETGSEEEPSSAYKNGFFWVDGKNTDDFKSYRLPFADVVEGEIVAVPRAIFQAAEMLESADVPEEDIAGLRDTIGKYYEKMQLAWNDPTVIPAWQGEESTKELGDESTENNADESGEEQSDLDAISAMLSDIQSMVDQMKGDADEEENDEGELIDEETSKGFARIIGEIKDFNSILIKK